ncbi:hypothetical protein AAFF_G00174520 [Aldrovandia affinis]|uniref:EGF-like domain-containing protein n=1 Tax=Aldrovandia affinis TaxID=143900 RepID=A0AAD7W7L6_9TELE|nr:hypothetical protein AAFF_G00174520 [Aldrovandia affinis]
MDTASYTCMCPLGWQGQHCDREVSLTPTHLVGNSYLNRYPKHHTRDLTRSKVSFDFSTDSEQPPCAVTINDNRTVIKVSGEQVVFQDMDPFE